MKIAEVMNKGKTSQEFLLLLSKQESRVLVDILTTYCEQNKKHQTARKYLKELENNLTCY